MAIRNDPPHLSQQHALAHAPYAAAGAASVAAVGKAGGGRGRACLRVLADFAGVLGVSGMTDDNTEPDEGPISDDRQQELF